MVRVHPGRPNRMKKMRDPTGETLLDVFIENRIKYIEE